MGHSRKIVVVLHEVVLLVRFVGVLAAIARET
jgi:hypothetical protein